MSVDVCACCASACYTYESDIMSVDVCVLIVWK